MANILETITGLFKDSIKPDGDPPPPEILNNIGARLGELTDISVDPSGAGIERWLSKLREITHDKRLHETLLVRVVQMQFTRLAELLTLLGIVKFEWGADPAKPVAFSIDWGKLNSFINNPGDEALTLFLSKVQGINDIKALKVLVLMLISAPEALLKLEYRQQGFMGLPVSQVPGINSQELLDIIQDLVQSPLRLPLPFDVPLTFDQFKAKAKPVVPETLGSLTLEGPNEINDFNQLAGFAIEVHLLNVDQAIKKTVDLGDGWKVSFASYDSAEKTYRLRFISNGLALNAPSEGEFEILLSKEPADGNALLIGEPNGTHFSIRSIVGGLRFHSAVPIFDFILRFKHIEFALRPDFLRFLSFGLNLPTLLQFDSDIEINYVQGKGLTAQRSVDNEPIALGVQFATPLNLKIGGSGAGLNIDQVVTRLEVTLKGSKLLFRTIFRYGATTQFGPLKAIMDGAGIFIGRWTNGNGGLLPPQGIGLSLDAGPVNGGGFLKIIGDNDFAGALQLKILGIGAFAYGLYKVLPNGDISFVVLIGIRLPPPGIQISFGFAVSGFGGLVGINRRADTDLIRERLASGSAGDVLFNDDPMKNAPRLLGDMQLFFPAESGIFLIGPTLQINWLYIIKLDAGFFIELPGPRKFFIAGTARLVIGSEDFALVYLRMDFVGGIDFAKSLIFFDAALVNSHVLGIFRITGGVALRIAYGENGYFLFSVGGFHPSFNPGSMELPRVPRVGVSYSLGPIWLKKEMYLAVTSNTFQLGSKIEAGLEIGPISAHGWFAFDALIQFKPFHFVGQIDAGFDVEVEGVSLCGVHVEGLLSGPGPLVLQAKASVRLLFIKVSGNITIELSSNPPEQIITIPDIPKYLKDKGELSKPENIRPEGDDTSVIFSPPQKGEKLFTPVGGIIWEQKRVPLNLPIQKLEGVELGGWHTIVASTPLSSSREDDWFGVGTYLKLSDGEALNNARFARQQSGLRVGADVITEGPSEEGVLEISLVKLPKRTRFLDAFGNDILFSVSQYINPGLSSVLGERSAGVKLEPGKAKVTVEQEAWNTHGTDGKIQNKDTLNGIQAFVKAKQAGGIALPAVEKQLNLTGVL